jgi:hypothetical protein
MVLEPGALYCVSLFSFFIPISLNSSSLFSYPYSLPLYFPSFFCTTIQCSPSHLLFLPLLTHSFPCLHLIFLSSPSLSPQESSLLHICHLLTSLLQQLYTNQVHCNPWHKHSTGQQQKYTHTHTHTHTRTTKPSSPKPFPPPSTFFSPPLLMPPLSISQISISSLKNIPPKSDILYIISPRGLVYNT